MPFALLLFSFFLTFTASAVADIKPVSKRPPGVNSMIFADSKCVPLTRTVLMDTSDVANKRFFQDNPKLEVDLSQLCVSWVQCDYKAQAPDEKDSTTFAGLFCFPENGKCPDLKTCALHAVSPPAEKAADRKRKIIPDYLPVKQDKPRNGQEGLTITVTKQKDAAEAKVAVLDNFPPSDGKSNFCAMPIELDPKDFSIPQVILCPANGEGLHLDCPGPYECLEKRLKNWKPAPFVDNRGANAPGGFSLRDGKKGSESQPVHKIQTY